MKGIIWCHRLRFIIAVHTAHQHRVVSVSCFIHIFSSGVQGRSLGDRVVENHNLNFKALCENERHNLMLLMSFFIAVHTGFAVIFGMCWLYVVCKYHIHFLGPYSIITHRGIVLCLLYQGVLNWFYCLDSLSSANVLFIYSAVVSRDEAPPPEAGAFF